MSDIQIVSTDSPEVVQAALGDLAAPAEPKPEETAEPKETDLEAKPKDGEEPPKEGEDPENPETPEETDEDEEELEVKPKEGDDKPKKKSGFEKRISKLSARAAAAEQEREFWRQEALRSRSGEKTAANPEEKPAAPSKELTAKPKKEDFETIEAYEEKRDEWVRKQAVEDFKKEQRDQETKKEQARREKEYSDRVAKFVKEEAEDFNEVLKSTNAPLSLVMQQAIRESEVGPKIVYELAKNPAEAERIFNLSATRQAVEIGKLETKFLEKEETPNPSQERKTTAAPKPVTPVKGKGTVVTKDIYDPDISQEEYNRIRNKQEKERAAHR